VGVYLVSINRSRYSAVYGGGHAKTASLHAAISVAAHQRQRKHLEHAIRCAAEP
jgi:hypothetical protein